MGVPWAIRRRYESALVVVFGFVGGGRSAEETTPEAHNRVYDYNLVNTKHRKNKRKIIP